MWVILIFAKLPIIVIGGDKLVFGLFFVRTERAARCVIEFCTPEVASGTTAAS